ncbi:MULTISPECIES: fumarylacetoacetate hydrolase family protein [Paenibacillus]|uniref:5-carboxymethyl-2-hydroxymuconate isomerase n=1 Tax=Paenibacillus naphthalenovorans TaxID=162209 RepID=A0A0U2UF09_9BACL|nr:MULTISPECIES: fumarylacetoacetate hydrolase family protein [Paenibacillus]ALS20513.1 5-carboxymethyl-2-hydroxymuconate isomerase [Paenibacillus naphthalenovorans]
MKLVTFGTRDNKHHIGVLKDNSSVIDIRMASNDLGIPLSFESIIHILEDPEGLEKVQRVIDAAGKHAGPWYRSLNDIKLTAPIPRPGKILGVALNYHDFCVRGKLDTPTALKVFMKAHSTVVGPNDAVHVPLERKVTYEGELGVVIGKTGKHVASADAWDHVAGYLIVNDFTANDYIKEDVQLMRGKNLDTFCPMGPFLVTKEEIADPGALAIKTEVNGIVRQNSNTSRLIFKIPEIIEYFSSFLTLEPGDVIATGTPAGTALQFDPPAFVQPGDVVAVTVEGLGTLTNIIRS